MTIGKEGTGIVNVAARVRVNGAIAEPRVAVGCVAAVPVRATGMEERLAGAAPTEPNVRLAAQGLGEAFYEHMLYGDDGQPLTASLMDYAMPRASDMPPLLLGETVTPNPFHPLGVKGVGEAGCNGAPPAVANAVMDALAPLGIDHIDMPYTAPKLWEALRAASGKRIGRTGAG